MIYTEKIRKAIKFAIKTHEVYRKQKRKGKDIAYITHPLTVALILALAGAKEEVIMAGILHDTIEDSKKPKKVTPSMVEERFGRKVKDLVVSVTEEKKDLRGKAISWAVRKAKALEHVRNFSQGSILVKSADILSNVSETLDDYRREGDIVFSRFNAPKEKVIENQLKVIAAILKRWPKSPLAGDLKKLAEEVDIIKRQSKKS